jgi:hypothetical protein
VAAGRPVRRFEGASFGLRTVAFSPDGKTLSAGGEDKTIRLWEVSTGKDLGVLEGHEHFVGSVAFAPDGKLLASSGLDNTVRLWDLATLREIRKLEGHREYVVSVAFSPDGRLLASASWDRTVAVWEVASGIQIYQFSAGRYGFGHAVFSPDGRFLAAARLDGTTHLWEVASRSLVHTFARGGKCLAFTPDGRVLAAAQGDTTVLLWDVAAAARGKLPGPGGPLSVRELDELWADLSGDAGKAYGAVGRLAAAPGQAVPFLRDRLRLARPADAELGKHIQELIAELDSDDFSRREKASEALEKVGEAAEPSLRQALDGQPSVEARRRLEKLLAKLGGPLPPPERLRALRALAALEQAGTPEARRLAAELAKGEEGAWLTREAQAVEVRMGRRAGP